VAKWTLRGTLPLVLAAALVLGGCDDEEEKDKIVEVHAEEGVEVRVIQKGKDDNEMIVIGELVLFTAVIVWALFGAGATRRRDVPLSEDG